MHKQLFTIVSIFSLLFILVGCGQTPIENKLVFSEEDFDQQVVTNNNQFGFELLKNLKEDEDENILISPLSISIALAMTVNGADGETKEAMLEALSQQGVSIEQINQSFQALINILQYSDKEVELSIANSLWGREDKSFFDQFIETNELYYDANLTALDFQHPSASKTINNWVKEKTRGKIEDIVDEDIDPNTVLFLINAIYFYGDWEVPFPEGRTNERPFYDKDGHENLIPMMANEDSYDYFENELLQAIRLPYGEGRIAMDIFLPHGHIDHLLEQLTIENWLTWQNSFQKRSGYIEMPRFTFEYEKSLVDTLKLLGMEIAFDEQRANFGKMAQIPPNLYISDVRHKTFIDVNEKGTEAAAVTSVEVRGESAPMHDFEIRINRPFLYVIHDTVTETVMFIGTIEETGSLQ